MKRVIAFLLVLTMILGTLTACGSSESTNDNSAQEENKSSQSGETSKTDDSSQPAAGTGESYTLVVWGAQDDQELLKEMCNAYAEANPQNTYKFLFGIQGENDAADKLLNDVEAGPDVFSFASDQINKLITAGALARLGGSTLDTVKSSNSPESVDACTVNIGGEDQVYAYPCTADNGYFLYYDKRVFSDTDVQTMDGIVAKISPEQKFAMELANGWYMAAFFFAFDDLKYDVSYDDTMTETAISINFNSANGMKAAKAIYELICNPGVMPSPDDSKIKAGFADGSIVAAVSGSWNAADIKATLGENLGVSKLPTFTVDGEQKQLSSYAGYKLIGVNNYSKNKAEAQKLALWLTNEQNQIKRFEARGFAPSNINAAAADIVKNDMIVQAVEAQRAFARNQKGVPSTFWTPMNGLGNAMIAAVDGSLDDASLQEQLDAMCANINK